DMSARKLNPHTQRSHISSCKRFAAYLKRSPDTATADDIRLFQLHLVESGASICNRNRIMTGLRFLFRVTLRRLDLAAEIYHIREPQKIPLVMSPDETRRLLAVASNLKVRTLLSLSYGCGLRAGEVMPSPPIHRRTDARQSGWLSVGCTPADCEPINRPAVIANPVCKRSAGSARHPHPC